VEIGPEGSALLKPRDLERLRLPPSFLKSLPNPRQSAFICGKLGAFPDHWITRDLGDPPNTRFPAIQLFDLWVLRRFLEIAAPGPNYLVLKHAILEPNDGPTEA